MITFLKGDATDPETRQGDHPTPTIIAHIVNDAGGWGRGFVVALSKKSKIPENGYRKWYREQEGGRLPLGASQLLLLHSGLWVANMVAQHGWSHDKDGLPPIRYDALATALGAVNQEAKMTRASISMPRIGCGLAGGSWDKVEEIIETAVDVPVFVYDLT